MKDKNGGRGEMSNNYWTFAGTKKYAINQIKKVMNESENEER